MTVLTHFLLWNLGLAKPWTWYSAGECESLERYARGKKKLAEIGCWQGVNTRRLRSVMDSEGVLVAVDPYPPGRIGFNAAQRIAHREVGKCKNGRVRWMKMTDGEAAREIKESGEGLFDFIFSDSLNTYEGLKAAWEAWSPLAASGCVYIIANSAPAPGRGIEKAGSVVFTREVILKDSRFHLRETVETFTILERLSWPENKED